MIKFKHINRTAPAGRYLTTAKWRAIESRKVTGLIVITVPKRIKAPTPVPKVNINSKDGGSVHEGDAAPPEEASQSTFQRKTETPSAMLMLCLMY